MDLLLSFPLLPSLFLVLLLLSPAAHATAVAGTIERTTKQRVLASILPTRRTPPCPSSPPLRQVHRLPPAPRDRPRGRWLRQRLLLRPGAGHEHGAEHESECGPVSSANTCAAVFTAYGLQVFDGSTPVWDTGAQSADDNFLQTLELVDHGDMRIRDKYGELAWKASDDPRANQGCGLPGSPGLGPALPPFAVPIGGDDQNLPFGRPASGGKQLPQSNTMYDQQQQHPLGGASQAFGFDGQPLVDNSPYDSGCYGGGAGRWVGIGVALLLLLLPVLV
ncbi:hypothetical protein MUK42_02781 [Musa troglodytarum]|uniref:Uncharacterized protein n=1 Tax=Musa troglodytarum TaxID=320322 RepID=A0A9E7HJF7_9LILI|nr:hypothetical protein MUK42_02781 [Musa troglodytarum]